MPLPNAASLANPNRLDEALAERGVSRRDFLEYCGSLCVVLGIGKSAAPKMMRALLTPQRPPVIWLQLQECTGCVESVLRSGDPTIGDLILDMISLDYQHTLMAGAGEAVEKAKQDSMKANAGKYILMVTGSIPTKDGGIYCTVGGGPRRSSWRKPPKAQPQWSPSEPAPTGAASRRPGPTQPVLSASHRSSRTSRWSTSPAVLQSLMW
jgi:NiFe hydrogenase small subunit HydA